ncbi:hypothetical protein PT279_09120 [Bifidobacterium sp. ESL0784]|uniref:hypothetical protein n=1 Tax=Bifidobacterium sp. ESL0784 TaxID=2983231 RepID=UPI0023F9FCBD|nr:hypothetical protein [Bifidobacterium sp. ESL0784]MDF7641743.1 hypothetical protein [Bifidobacterium sp. ESL0784]
MFANNNQQYNNGYGQQPQYGGGNTWPQQGQPRQQPVQPQGGQLSGLDDLLSGSGAKAFFGRDSQPGSTVTGTLELIETQQVRDFNTQQPAFWNDGKPQQEIHMVIQTTLRDDEDDDGRRSLYVKGWGGQLKAFREAMRNAGIKKAPKPGDTITETYVGADPQSKNPAMPAKLYSFVIQPANSPDTLLNPQQNQPTQNQQTGYTPQQQGQFQQPTMQQPALAQNQQFQQTNTAQQAQSQQYQPQPQPSATPPMQTGPQVNLQQLQQLQALGKSPQEIAALIGLPETTVTNALQPNHGSEDDVAGNF